MKPSQTPLSTGTLPRSRAKAVAVAKTSGRTAAGRTTSTSFITWAGAKKCSPTTRPGSATVAAMRSTSR